MKKILVIITSILTTTIFITACSQSEIEHVQSATDSYSSQEANYEENDRTVIKTAQISLQVAQLEKSILDLKTFLRPLNGYVYKYDITNHRNETDQFQKNMDSLVTVEKILPHSNLSVRIPVAHADSFINFILKSDAQIASLKIGDDDITENLSEKKQVAAVYANSKKAQRTGRAQKDAKENIAYDNNTAIDAIRAKAAAAKMQYKSQYLWFDIDMSAQPFYATKTTLAAANYRTPLYVSLVGSLSTGWYVFADIMLALLTIWPLILIGLIMFLVYRKYRLRLG